MADAPTEQAIAISTGIVGALHAAGVLQPQAALSTSAPPAGSEAIAISTGIVSALSAAGVLRGQGTPATPPPTPPGPEVGDVVVANIRQIAKLVWTDPPAHKYRLTHEGSNTTYELEFPPNDEIYIAEFERLMSMPVNRPLIITANMRITKKISPDVYGVELGRLAVFAGFG